MYVNKGGLYDKQYQYYRKQSNKRSKGIKITDEPNLSAKIRTTYWDNYCKLTQTNTEMCNKFDHHNGSIIIKR